MTSAYETDFEALGIPDHSPFDILHRPKAEPRATEPKKKPGRPPTSASEKTIRALSDNTTSPFNTPIETLAQADRTRAIGRRV